MRTYYDYKCSICNNTYRGTSTNRIDNEPICQRCYWYLRKHPEGRYPLPEKGTVVIAPNGDPVCHICGEAHRKLGNHLYNAHHITHNDYCDKYGLLRNTRLSNGEYQKMMREYNEEYSDIVVKENLIKCGKETQYKEKEYVEGRGKHLKMQVIYIGEEGE